jgi:serine/threonine protein kinase
MPAPARSAPPKLKGFTFVKTIGGGGFADVYAYRQHRPSRLVAIKVLRREHLNPASLKRFEDEADRMAEVSQHLYIVSIFLTDTAPDGRPFIVMEHYPEPSFDIRARGALSAAEVLRVGVQITSAVHAAHSASILHRDIKPANILTSAYGNPGLTDFGIAGLQASGDLEAPTGLSFPYAPPEIINDARAGGSPASDIYSLSATIYHLLAGRPPHWILGGDNSDVALGRRATAGRPPPTGRADIGPLDDLLLGAMDPDPGLRPQSALVFAAELNAAEAAIGHVPTPFQRSASSILTRPVDRSGDDGTTPDVVIVYPDGPTPGPPDPGPTGQGPTSSRPEKRPRSTAPDAGSLDVDGPSLAPTWVVVLGVIALMMIVAFAGYGLTRSSEAQDADEAMSSTTFAPSEPLVPIDVTTPPGLKATWDEDGRSLHATWSPSPEADAYELTYRLQPVDSDGNVLSDDAISEAFEPAQALDGTEVTLTVDPGDLELCVAVLAISESQRGSDPSSPVCPAR